MTGESLERQLIDRAREAWINALVALGAPEHTEEAAALMAAHRDAEAELPRTLAWERALGLTTRHYRRRTT